MRDRRFIKPAAYLVIFFAIPNINGCMFYFYTNKLQMGKEQMAVYNIVTQVTQTVGVLMFAAPVLSRLPLQWVMTWGVLLSQLVGSSQLLLLTGYNQILGVPDFAFLCLDGTL